MISLVTEYFLAIALFFSFITLIFYGFPVAWTMGGLGVLFIFISMLSDNLFDTFYGVESYPHYFEIPTGFNADDTIESVSEILCFLSNHLLYFSRIMIVLR